MLVHLNLSSTSSRTHISIRISTISDAIAGVRNTIIISTRCSSNRSISIMIRISCLAEVLVLALALAPAPVLVFIFVLVPRVVLVCI